MSDQEEKDRTRQARLSDEIIESQKSRSELLKWKLLLVSAIGSAGLGLIDKSGKSHTALLGLIPFVCVYVDLLCTNTNLRIRVIGEHYRNDNDAYECLVERRRIVYSLEDWALYGSTYCVSLLLLIFGIIRLALSFHNGWHAAERLADIGLLCAAIIGIVLTKWHQKAYMILSSFGELDEAVDARVVFFKALSQQDRLFKFASKIFQPGKISESADVDSAK